MNVLHRISNHLVRLQRQLGRKVTIGPRRYAVKGYISNVLSVEADTGWEPELDQIFADALRNEGCFIDVGMNLGQTLSKVLNIDPDRSYVGFEPQVLACAMVDLFIKNNGLTNCTTLPIGLSDENGIMSFFSAGDADTMASLHDRDGVAKISIPVRIGDEVVRELGVEAISAIKIDVEGAEPEVIAGLSDTIRVFKPQVIFEVLPNYEGHERTPIAETAAEQRRQGAARIMQLFDDLDYVVHQPQPDGTLRQVDRFDLDTPATFVGSNFVARPS